MLHRSKSERGVLLVGAVPAGDAGALHVSDLGRVLAGAGTRVRYADAEPHIERARRPLRPDRSDGRSDGRSESRSDGRAEGPSTQHEPSEATRGTERASLRSIPPPIARIGARARLVAELAFARACGDLVHVHVGGGDSASWRLLRWLAATVSAAPGERGSLLTLHDPATVGLVRRHPNRCRAILSSWHRVICAAPEIELALLEAGVPAARLVVAPPFSPSLLPATLAPAGLAAIRQRHPLILGAALGRGRNAGAEVLLDAFAMLQRTNPGAALVAFGAAAREPAFDERVRRSGVGGVYRFGALLRGEALGVIRACDVFVRPAIADGDAIPVREALALGVRTVASDAAPRPSGATVFRAGDAVALAAAIEEALAGPTPVQEGSDALAVVLGLYRAAGVRTPGLLVLDGVDGERGESTVEAEAGAVIDVSARVAAPIESADPIELPVESADPIELPVEASDIVAVEPVPDGASQPPLVASASRGGGAALATAAVEPAGRTG